MNFSFWTFFFLFFPLSCRSHYQLFPQRHPPLTFLPSQWHLAASQPFLSQTEGVWGRSWSSKRRDTEEGSFISPREEKVHTVLDTSIQRTAAIIEEGLSEGLSCPPQVLSTSIPCSRLPCPSVHPTNRPAPSSVPYTLGPKFAFFFFSAPPRSQRPWFPWMGNGSNAA